MKKETEGRIPEIDLARGFTVFIMAAVHSVMIYSQPSVHSSWLGDFLFFLAEGPGAPLFMMMMGISFVLGSARRKVDPSCAGELHPSSREIKLYHQPIQPHIKRAIYIFALAYILNAFKFILPLIAGTIPDKLLVDFGITTGQEKYTHLFLLGDILQLAAFSLIVMAVISRLKHYHLWAIMIALFIAVLSPFVWNIHLAGNQYLPAVKPSEHFNAIDLLLYHIPDLFFGFNSRVYFPVFPWMAFPLAGMAVGYFLQRVRQFYSVSAKAGIIMMIFGSGIATIVPTIHNGDFYRMGPGNTLYHIGFVLLWLGGWHLTNRFLPENSVFKLLRRMSMSITRVYFIQWILIFWLIPVFGYQSLNLADSMIVVVVVSILVILINNALIKFRKWRLVNDVSPNLVTILKTSLWKNR